MSRQSRWIYRYALIGLVLVVLGAIGVVVPGLPTTIFLIAAAACFAKSSPCLHAWLLSHPWFGSFIRNWQESRSISKRAKLVALCSMIIACIISWFTIENIAVRLLVYASMIFPFIFVLRLPLTEELNTN